MSSVTYRLASPAGRPLVMSSNGDVVPLCTASDPILDIPALKHSTPEQWLERARLFADSGVHTWSLQPMRQKGYRSMTYFWTGDGEYPEPAEGIRCINWQAERLLEIDPQASFFVRFGDQTPESWYKANPEHTQRNCTGEQRQWGSSQISLASRKGLTDLIRYIIHTIDWCERQPWRDRVFGYMFLPHGEGISNLVVSGMIFDVCPAMQTAFQDFVRGRYASDAALREAWQDEEVTLETVRVPHDAEWRAAQLGVEHWIEGNQLQRFRDYFELQRELSIGWYRRLIREVRAAIDERRTCLFGIDMAKQHLLGWQHNLFFNGAGPGPEALEMFNASGSIDVGELLDEPGLDMLLTPADYTARSIGYGWEPEGIADSLCIRGKAIFIENDSRTFSQTGGEHLTSGAFRNEAEVRAGFLRNCAWILTRGGYDEWGTGGGSYYDKLRVQEVGIRPCVELMNAARDWPHRETEHAVAMIVDDRSPWYEDGSGGFQNIACIWQRVLGLAHCGIPYRIYLFSDLDKAEMPDYRAYYFPNLFQLDEERLALLRKKVFRDGRLSIFGPATGITDGKSLGAEWASRVLGVEMEMVRKRAMRRVIVQGNHPIVEALPSAVTYGDSFPYGPVLVPGEGALAAAGADELGMATLVWAFNRPGLFVKDHGSHKVAWTAALPMPANLLRELARWGGCHVWCEDDAVVLASDSIAALHTAKPGPHTLKLPENRRVWDLLEQRSLGEIGEIEMRISPPETRLYHISAEAPLG